MAKRWILLALLGLGLAWTGTAHAQFPTGPQSGPGAFGSPTGMQGPAPIAPAGFYGQPGPGGMGPIPGGMPVPGGMPGANFGYQEERDLTEAPPVLMSTREPNAFVSDESLASRDPFVYSSITVDFLALWSHWDRNPAAIREHSVNGILTRDNYDFEYGSNFAPRIKMNFQFGPYWGIRGSWMKLDQAASHITIENSDPGDLVSSIGPAFGNVNFRNLETITLGGASNTTATEFSRSVPLVVSSPEPYFFTGLVPTETLLQFPPQPLPPFTLSSGLQTGFPDQMIFGSSLRMQVADLEATRYIEYGSAHGVIGLGLRYTNLSQNYFAARKNFGGSVIIPGYDPFIAIIDDAVINLIEDTTTVSYAHEFYGVGPKFSFEIGADVSSFARLYSNFNGTVLMGNRREVGFYNSRQVATISDISQFPPAQLQYEQVVTGPGAAFQRDSFTVIPFGECEIGAEVRMGGALFPVFRVAFVGQYLAGAGNATNPNEDLFIYGVSSTIGFGF